MFNENDIDLADIDDGFTISDEPTDITDDQDETHWWAL